MRCGGMSKLRKLVHLRSMGLEIKFFSIAKKDLTSLEAECIEVVGEPSNHEAIIAAIDRLGKFQVPEGAKEIPWPSTDLPTIKREASLIDASLKKHDSKLGELAGLTGSLQDERKHYQTQADFHVAQNSGLKSSALFALQGWVPSDKAGSLSDNIAKHNIAAAVEVMPARKMKCRRH